VNVQERIELGQKDRPVDELLAAYAAGTLSAPLAVLMAAHLELKPARRVYVAALEAAYGILLEETEPVPLTNRDRRLVEIFASEETAPNRPVAASLNGHHYNGHGYNARGDVTSDESSMAVGEDRPGTVALVPVSLQRLMGRNFEDLEWRTAASGVKQSTIASGSFGEASLMRFRAGKRTPAHSHEGLEVTLVLEGGFSDGYGQYRRGDVCVADETVEHQPIADPGQDCLVFVVRSAPTKFVGTMDRFIQLLLGR